MGQNPVSRGTDKWKAITDKAQFSNALSTQTENLPHGLDLGF